MGIILITSAVTVSHAFLFSVKTIIIKDSLLCVPLIKVTFLCVPLRLITIIIHK